MLNHRTGRQHPSSPSPPTQAANQEGQRWLSGAVAVLRSLVPRDGRTRAVALFKLTGLVVGAIFAYSTLTARLDVLIPEVAALRAELAKERDANTARMRELESRVTGRVDEQAKALDTVRVETAILKTRLEGMDNLLRDIRADQRDIRDFLASPRNRGLPWGIPRQAPLTKGTP